MPPPALRSLLFTTSFAQLHSNCHSIERTPLQSPSPVVCSSDYSPCRRSSHRHGHHPSRPVASFLTACLASREHSFQARSMFQLRCRMSLVLKASDIDGEVCTEPVQPRHERPTLRIPARQTASVSYRWVKVHFRWLTCHFDLRQQSPFRMTRFRVDRRAPDIDPTAHIRLTPTRPHWFRFFENRDRRFAYRSPSGRGAPWRSKIAV